MYNEAKQMEKTRPDGPWGWRPSSRVGAGKRKGRDGRGRKKMRRSTENGRTAREFLQFQCRRRGAPFCCRGRATLSAARSLFFPRGGPLSGRREPPPNHAFVDEPVRNVSDVTDENERIDRNCGRKLLWAIICFRWCARDVDG